MLVHSASTPENNNLVCPQRSHPKDLTGKRFGRLVCVRYYDRHKQNSGSFKTRWLCKCDCGSDALAHATSLNYGSTLSCGCIRREKTMSH